MEALFNVQSNIGHIKFYHFHQFTFKFIKFLIFYYDIKYFNPIWSQGVKFLKNFIAKLNIFLIAVHKDFFFADFYIVHPKKSIFPSGEMIDLCLNYKYLVTILRKTDSFKILLIFIRI